MITISDNDFRQLIRFAIAVDSMAENAPQSDHFRNQARMVRVNIRKMLRRPDVQRIMNGCKKSVVADSLINQINRK
ncbi:MAG: hypothetical protein HDS59_00170 [Barnesiella sp.]|nr:hypothetical protein [Barnesiella sp.]